MAIVDSDSGEDVELLRDQWRYSIETFRFALGLMVQGIGFLVAADTALLAYGLKEKSAAVIAVGATIPLVMILTVLLVSLGTAPVAATAIRTEQKLAVMPFPLVSTFASIAGPGLVKSVQTSQATEFHEMNPRPRFAFRGRRVIAVLALASLVQAAIALWIWL